MDVLDYRMELNPKQTRGTLTVRKIAYVEDMNHGFYFYPEGEALMAVPYGDMGQVLHFTEPNTFHLYLFRKDAAYAKAAFRKFLKENGLEEASKAVAKKSFEPAEDLIPMPLDKEIREQIRKDDRSKLIHRGSSAN